jgi:flagellar basal body rod protein FlgC
MVTLSASSLAGMNAAQSALQASAQNIANFGAADTRRRPPTVDLGANADGGTSSAGQSAAGFNDQLVSDMVTQLQAKNSFLANLAVFRTGDQMLGSLLQISA